mgnify:CR=1 FL=1
MELSTEIAALEPTLEETLLLGQALLQSRRLEEALREFQAALHKAPEMAHIHMLIGKIHSRQHEYDQADESFQNASRLDPLSPEPLLALARLHLHCGVLDKAEEEFRAALAIEPTSDLAMVGLGKIALEQGFLDEAERHLNAALSIVPDLVEARLPLADVYQKRQRWEDAIGVLEEAPQTGIQTPMLKLKLGEILLNSKRYREARQVLERSRADYPMLIGSSGPAQLNLIEAYLGTNNPNGAQEQLAAAIDFRILASRQQRLRGLWKARIGDDQSSMAAFLEAWRIDQQRHDNETSVGKPSDWATAVLQLQQHLQQNQLPMRSVPVVELESGHVVGWVVTLEWSEDRQAQLEISGGSIPLGWWLIAAACRHLSSTESRDTFVWVGLSDRQLEDQNLGDQLALAAGAFDLTRSAVLPLIRSDQLETTMARCGDTLKQLASIEARIAITARSLEQNVLDTWMMARPRFLVVPCQLLLDLQADSSEVQQRKDVGLETVASDISSAEELAQLQSRGIVYGMGPYLRTISTQ